MKKIYPTLVILIIIAGLFPVSLTAQNPTYLLELRNDVQVSATVYEFDIYLLRTGTTEFEYASGQYGIVINPLIKNGGVIQLSLVASSPDPVLVASNQTPASVSFYEDKNVIRVAARTPPGAGNGALISNVSPGIRLCRVRLSNTADFGQYQPNLTWTTNTFFPTQVFAYVGGTNTAITNYSNHTTGNLANPVLNAITASDDYASTEPGMRVYPNPFNDRVTIDYNLVNKTQVKISVFDTNGKLIDDLVDDVQQAGSYTIPWIPGSLNEGTYLVKLQTGLNQKISRITLIR
jgi:hypothetical protein